MMNLLLLILAKPFGVLHYCHNRRERMLIASELQYHFRGGLYLMVDLTQNGSTMCKSNVSVYLTYRDVAHQLEYTLYRLWFLNERKCCLCQKC